MVSMFITASTHMLAQKSESVERSFDAMVELYANDRGTHATCAVLTTEFLQFSKSKGNDLMTPRSWGFPGLVEGNRWCLCSNRWNEVYRAYRRGEVSENAVPRIVITASHKKSIEMIDGGLDTLQKFALTEVYPTITV